MPQSSKRSKAAKKRMAAPEDHGSPVEVKLPREKKAKPLGVGPPPYPKAKHTKPNSTNKQTYSENHPIIPNSTNKLLQTLKNNKLLQTLATNDFVQPLSVHRFQTPYPYIFVKQTN